MNCTRSKPGGPFFAGIAPLEVLPDGRYRWEPGPGREYVLTEAGYRAVKIASEALMSGLDEADAAGMVPLEIVQRLTPEDKEVMRENRYDFVFA